MMQFLPTEELELRQSKLQKLIKESDYDALLISSNANIYYISGMVFAGYVYVPAEGQTQFLIRRPVGIEGKNVAYIRKPEQIIETITAAGLEAPKRLAIECVRTSFSIVQRLAKATAQNEILNGSRILAKARSVKTDYEIAQLKRSGILHDEAYKHIESIYEEGMTDYEFQIEMERHLRLNGCLGVFRISGETMEIFMGNLLAGDNADNPTPYDFAMGGEGMNQSLPIGCNGTIINPGNSVMVDMNGNFTGYMTDMTRTFYIGHIADLAQQAHQLSIDIHNRLKAAIVPGFSAAEAYKIAEEMVKEAGMDDYFMGHKQKAGFIGHGVGIEVNELPVLAPRSKDIFEAGNVIAIEPKFVIPGTGAVGIENTYVVTASGLEQITNFPEELTEL